MEAQLTRKEQKAADLEHATFILNKVRDSIAAGNPLLIAADYGSGMTDYFRVSVVTGVSGISGESLVWSLTWAIAQTCGYSLRDRAGRWHLAISGYGYSKPYDIARHLAAHYGTEQVRYELI